MRKLEKAKTFKISRRRWLRGEGQHNSYLRRSADNKMCCLGFYSLECGAEKSEITGRTMPKMLEGLILPNWLASKKKNSIINKIATCNDDFRMDDKGREAKLVKLFKRVGVEVEFVT